MSKPLLSIVTGTRNRPAEYKRFMDSVYRTVPDSIPYEIVIGDANDGNERESYTFSEYRSSHEHIIFQRPRKGMIKDYNECFRACAGEWVAWFNDDVECLLGWAENALSFMQEHPEVGVGAIYFLDHCRREPPAIMHAEDTAKLPAAVKHANGWNTQFCIQSLWNLYYANFGILRKSLGDELGWFDEKSGAMYGASDTHLCFSAIAAGHAVVGIPNAKVLHYRTRDNERHENLKSRFDDREVFDSMWAGRVDELQEKNAKYSYLTCPKTID